MDDADPRTACGGEHTHVDDAPWDPDRFQADSGPRQLDYLYNEIDQLYHVFAYGCGISDCAYWMLYDLQIAGGSLPVSTLTASWSYSKQTINSALKSLEARGLIELDFVEGSRKSKVASFTKAGRVFSRERIIPAIEAEERAFSTLASREREQLVVLVKRYVDALDAEIGRAHECVERVEGKQEDAVRASCDLWGESEPCPGEH